MRRFILALAFLVPALLRGQAVDFAYHLTSAANPLNGGPAAAAFPYSGTPVLGDMIYFDGTNWVSIPKGTNTQVLTEQTSGIPHWAASAAGTTIATDPIWTAAGQLAYGTGTATAVVLGIGSATTVLHGGASAPAYSAIVNGDITNATIDLTTKVTGTLPVANGGTGVATAAIHGVMVGNAASAQNVTAAGATGQHLVGNDSADPTWETFPFDLTKWDVINTSFYQHGTTTGAAVINSFNVTATGSGAGYQSSPAMIPDGNHPNILEMTTGTASTGGATLGPGLAGTSTVGNGLVLSGGEVLDWLVYLPVVSGGTNTTQLYVGFCDTIGNAVCVNGVFFKWDENANTNWQIDSVKATVHSGPTASNTDATAAAWHHLRIEANSNATSFAMKVDGVALNVSPITTQIPVTVVFPEVKYVASAGCAAATTCVVNVNTIYYRKPVTR